MASGLEVVAAISSFVQLIDATVKVANRLNDYREKQGEIPGALLQISLLLPVFIEVVRDTNAAALDGRISDTARHAINPILIECNAQISVLKQIVAEVLPKKEDPSLVLFRKAVRSLKYDSRIKRVEGTIRKYLDVISLQGIASARNKDASGK